MTTADSRSLLVGDSQKYGSHYQPQPPLKPRSFSGAPSMNLMAQKVLTPTQEKATQRVISMIQHLILPHKVGPHQL